MGDGRCEGRSWVDAVGQGDYERGDTFPSRWETERGVERVPDEEGGVREPALAQPAPPLRRRPPAAVPRVRGQQQREALRHLRLQWLQRLLQEECEAEAYLQVGGWAPPGEPREGRGVGEVARANTGKVHRPAPEQDTEAWGLPLPAGARWGQGCAQWTRPTGTSARPAD